MPAPKPITAWLVKSSGEQVALGATCSLGRSSANDIVVQSGNVSRRHATIHQRAPGEFWLADLGSINGTWLNERRITQPTQLFDGDRVSVGEVTLVFLQTPGSDGSPLATASGGTVREVREVACWMLVAGIVDSTVLSHTMPSAEYATLVANWMQRCQALVEASGGQINRWQGESLIAVWPENEDAPPRVAATMWAMGEYFLESKIQGRIVVHRGTVSFGGVTSTGEENLLGAEVNYIFRLEKLATRLREPMVVSAAAQGPLQHDFPTKCCGSYTLKGFPGSHECWVLPTSRRVVLMESNHPSESTFLD